MYKFKFSRIIQRFFFVKNGIICVDPPKIFYIFFDFLFHNILRNKKSYIRTSSLVLCCNNNMALVVLVEVAGLAVVTARSGGVPILEEGKQLAMSAERVAQF